MPTVAPFSYPPYYWGLSAPATPAPYQAPTDNHSSTVIFGSVCGIVFALVALFILRANHIKAENRARDAANGTAVAADPLQARQQTSDGSPRETSSQTSAAAARKQRAKLARRPLVLDVLFPTQQQVRMTQDFECMMVILAIPARRNAHIVASIFRYLFLKKSDPEQAPSVHSLKYDQKSKRYMFSDDALEVNNCSICLEDLGK